MTEKGKIKPQKQYQRSELTIALVLERVILRGSMLTSHYGLF